MSEYQYYEFIAVERSLSNADMKWLRGLSTRAEITPTSFVNTYQWGDFKGDPKKLMERCFDAFVYVSNFGIKQLMLKFPKDALDIKRVTPYCKNSGCRLQKLKNGYLLLFELRDDSGDWDFDDDGSGSMGSLLPIRSELIAEDYRSLYLAWLLNIQDESFDAKDKEPPVPPGLKKLSASQNALASFLHVDADLIAMTAEASGNINRSRQSNASLLKQIRTMSNKEKETALAQLLSERGNEVRGKLLREFSRTSNNNFETKPRIDSRFVADLHAAWSKTR